VSYIRGGRTVRRFTRDEDAFIESLRVDGQSYKDIAAAVNDKFSTERSAHTVQCRLVMLSARDIEEEGAS
jgi:hypothetical protein